MKIVVLGTGGVGGYFGGLLAKAGNDVTFVARGEHFEALKKQGLQVKSVIGEFVVSQVKVVELISELDSPDLVLFTVKTYDTKKVAEELRKVISPNTVIITFQNGVENDLKIKSLIPNAHVFPGVCYLISARTAPGVISQTGGLRKLFFGDRFQKENIRLKEIEKVMKESEIDAIYSDNITRDLWKKFIFITAFSGMTALKREAIGEVIKDPQSLAQYKQVVKESIAVAKALEIQLQEDVFDITMKTTFNTAPASKSSLLHDIEKGRKTEIETLNGSLVKLARQLNIDAPMNEQIYQSLKETI